MATPNTYYIDTTLFSTATGIWTDAALTIPAPTGLYQAPVEDVLTVRQLSLVALGAPFACNCPIPFDMSIMAVSYIDACALTVTVEYFLYSLGSTPVAGDTIYTDALGTSFLANGYYKYVISGQGYWVYITGGSGVVNSVGLCINSTQWDSSAGVIFDNKCSAVIDQNYFHDGSGTFPTVGDKCYTDASASTPLVAGSTPYYRFNDTVPNPDVLKFLTITGSAGEVSAVTTCS